MLKPISRESVHASNMCSCVSRFHIYRILTQTLQKQHVKHPMSWIGHPSVSFLDNQDICTSKDYPTNLTPLLGDTCEDYYYLFHQGRQQYTFIGKFYFHKKLFVCFSRVLLKKKLKAGFRVYDPFLIANQKENTLSHLPFKV